MMNVNECVGLYTKSDVCNERSSEIGAKLIKHELKQQMSKERGRTKRSEVDVRYIKPGNEGERGRSRIEVVQSLMTSERSKWCRKDWILLIVCRDRSPNL